jgi:hypothetical protein
MGTAVGLHAPLRRHAVFMHVINVMVLAVLAATSLFQDTQPYQWNKKSTLTVQEQVEFPGIVLAPGVYVVRLKDSNERRSQVQITNQEETQVLATLVAIPDHRVRPDDNSEFIFHEMKGNGPTPIRSWFYTGDLVGLEFVYPEARAKEIAKATNDHVMASNDKGGAIVAVTPNGKEIVIDEDPAVQTARKKPQQ